MSTARPLQYHRGKVTLEMIRADLAGDRFQTFKFPRPAEIPRTAGDFGMQLADAGILFLPYERTVLSYRAADADVLFACQPGTTVVDGQNPAPIIVELWMEVRSTGEVHANVFGIGAKPGERIEIGPVQGSEEHFDESAASDGALLIYGFLGLLSSGMAHVERVVPDAKLQRARARRGKPPLVEHNVVTVRPSARADHEGGEAPGRRLHWRRGHVRRYQSGRVAVVRPHLVGTRELGEVVHDAYDLRNMVQLLGEAPVLEEVAS
jgi:hypothetical protein